jgi:hypothetical protein
MSRSIEIIIDNDGETKVEAHGYRGGKCVAATAPLTKALIGTPTTHIKKPDYYQGDHAAKVREME